APPVWIWAVVGGGLLIAVALVVTLLVLLGGFGGSPGGGPATPETPSFRDTSQLDRAHPAAPAASRIA
ncbi:MAG: hypothetical protein KDA41_00615, partial [Planctomycetales bacterium]|nr:hypothetical protein [Planctomycetales bacterium]